MCVGKSYWLADITNIQRSFSRGVTKVSSPLVLLEGDQFHLNPAEQEATVSLKMPALARLKCHKPFFAVCISGPRKEDQPVQCEVAL